MMKTLAAAVATFAAFGASGAFAQDVAAGETAFRQCSSCHVIATPDGEVLGGRGKTGPNLYGLPGRVAGSQADFDQYGDSLVAAGEAGLEWNEEDFLVYVENPRGFLQEYLDDNRARSKMSFRLRQGGADVWAYIASLSPEAE